MANQVVPTKGNLLATKKSLELSRTGFELLDRKRNILIREMMALIDRANSIQGKIDQTYRMPMRLCRELILHWESAVNFLRLSRWMTV